MTGTTLKLLTFAATPTLSAMMRLAPVVQKIWRKWAASH